MPLHRWFDVLVVAEQVGGIVLVLQGDQALVALAIGRPDQVCTFLDFTPDVVDVYAPVLWGRIASQSSRVHLRCISDSPGSSQAREDNKVVLSVALAVSGVVWAATTHGAARLLKHYAGQRGRDLLKVGDYRVDGAVADVLR